MLDHRQKIVSFSLLCGCIHVIAQRETKYLLPLHIIVKLSTLNVYMLTN